MPATTTTVTVGSHVQQKRQHDQHLEPNRSGRNNNMAPTTGNRVIGSLTCPSDAASFAQNAFVPVSPAVSPELPLSKTPPGSSNNPPVVEPQTITSPSGTPPCTVNVDAMSCPADPTCSSFVVANYALRLCVRRV